MVIGINPRGLLSVSNNISSKTVSVLEVIFFMVFTPKFIKIPLRIKENIKINTEINQKNENSNISQDFSGTIDFDDAEKKRLSAEKSSESKKNKIEEEKSKSNVVRRVKKTEASKKQTRPSQIKKPSYSRDDNKKEKSCLLYTSPSPRDRTRSRMPSSA